MKDDVLAVESSDLLKMAKTEKLIQIQAYQIRLHINLQKAGLSELQEGVVKMFAQKEANRLETEMLKQIDDLVKELKKLQEEDKRGNDKAGDLAEKKVKSVSDEIDDSLPEFGPHIRKAIEKAMGKKLPGASKTVASGGFRGIKLLAKFEHGGASAEIVKDFQDAAKMLDQAGEKAVAESKAEKKAVDALEEKIDDKIDEAVKAEKEKDGQFVDKLREKVRDMSKDCDSYVERVKDFQEFLTKTDKDLSREVNEISKDLSKPGFQAKKGKFDEVRKQFDKLQAAVDERLSKVKPIATAFKDPSRFDSIQDWKGELQSVKSRLGQLSAINANDFNKAVDAMVMESKKA